jgi:Skp family chaperone for outer membrane proteins
MKTNIATIPALVLAALAAQAQSQPSPAAKPPAAASATAPVPSAASATYPTRIGLINVREAMMKTADGKKATIDLEERFNARRSSLQKRQIDMQARQDQLTRGGAAMSDTAKAALAKDIDTETKKFKRDVEDLNTDADEEQSKLIQAIWVKMQPILQQYAMQNGFAAILDVGNEQSPVLWASNTVFIDDDIVSLYNQAHPPSAIAAPAVAPARAPAPPPVKK